MKKTKKEEVTPQAELLAALKILEEEKGIDREILIEAIENSLQTACRNQYDGAENVIAHVDRETGAFEVYVELTVVENVENPTAEISLEDAAKINPVFRVGDVVRKSVQSREFGRIAAQNAKNVILQKIREEERRSIFEEFSAKEHEVITGIIQRYNNDDLTVNIGRVDAVMKKSEQVATETYIPAERLKVLVVEVKNNTRGPRVFVSRTHPELVKRLFEAEVPEIQSGILEIKAISREAGSRTKMAVWSNDEQVDPIGTCVGTNGSRVNAVVEELGGEKIDIINWDDNSAQLIENALSPAKVICVLADDDEKTALVVVPDNQLSLAIGKMGQNVRLAVRLTGYKIDIKSETQAQESGLFEEIGYIEDYDEEFEEDEDAYADDSVYEEESDGLDEVPDEE